MTEAESDRRDLINPTTKDPSEPEQTIEPVRATDNGDGTVTLSISEDPK